MPDPVPVMVLSRLAVDHRAQGIKLGASLLQDAVNRAVVVSQNAGVRAMLVHALHDRAKQFYEHHGFKESPPHPMTLMLRLNIVKDPGTRTIYEKREDNARFAGDHIGAALASLHVAPGEVTLAAKKFTFAKSQSGGIALDKSIKQVALDCGLRK